MCYSVGLYQNFIRLGGILFRTVPTSDPADYDCTPEGILSHDQAEHVSWQLRRTPLVCQGAVGTYIWRQEEA